MYGNLKLWVLNIVGNKSMAPQKICVGSQNFKCVLSKICWYSKCVGTCTENLNFVGT